MEAAEERQAVESMWRPEEPVFEADVRAQGAAVPAGVVRVRYGDESEALVRCCPLRHPAGDLRHRVGCGFVLPVVWELGVLGLASMVRREEQGDLLGAEVEGGLGLGEEVHLVRGVGGTSGPDHVGRQHDVAEDDHGRRSEAVAEPEERSKVAGGRDGRARQVGVIEGDGRGRVAQAVVDGVYAHDKLDAVGVVPYKLGEDAVEDEVVDVLAGDGHAGGLVGSEPWCWVCYEDVPGFAVEHGDLGRPPAGADHDDDPLGLVGDVAR